MVNKTDCKPITLIVASAIFFSISSAAISVESHGNMMHGGDQNSLVDNNESALDIARLQIEKAINSYIEGDMGSSQRYLDQAIESLNKAADDSQTEIAREESRKLGIKIDGFKEKLSEETHQDENSLIRFWHQTVSIIKRETDQLIHSYTELSVSEKTLKHLLDAKMHLFMAQHDLFVSHHDQGAINELDNVLNYLNEAVQVAKPSIKKKVLDLSKNIEALKETITPGEETWKENDLVISLNQSIDTLAKAKNIASPHVKLRIKLLETEIQELRDDIQRSNIKNDYELAIVKLREIINEL